MNAEQESPLQPIANRTRDRLSGHVVRPNRWFRLLLICATVKSVLGLVILFLLLAGSISVFFIGFYFRHSHHCPIEPKINLFLIVASGVSIEWIILSIILSIITIVLKHIQSFIVVGFIIFTGLTIIISNLFLLIWMVFGSVWTLKVLDTVQYNTPHLNTFCHQTLYQFTAGYLVVTYIIFAVQCWYRLCIVVLCSIHKQ